MELLLRLVGAAVVVMSVAEPVFILAMTGTLTSIRVHETPQQLALRSLDAMPFAMMSLVAIFLTAAAIQLDDWSWAVILLPALGLAFGCRVELVVSPGSTRCMRQILWIIPWRQVRLRRATAWVDGWGDFADPEAFYIGEATATATVDEELFSLELAWGGGNSGDQLVCLADSFNRAVEGIQQTYR